MKVGEGDYGSKYNYDGGVGYKTGSSVSSLNLDLMMQNYVTNAAVQGTQVTNSIFIRKLDHAWGIAFYFQGCGGTFDYTYKAKQGRHYALRLLVELSVIESLGNYFDVPYWRCAPDLKPDEAMLKRVREYFEDCTDAERSGYLKSYLFLHGAPCVQIQGNGIDRNSKTLSSDEDTIVADAMSKWKSSTQVDLIMALWEGIPIQNAKARATEYARRVNASAEDKYKLLATAVNSEFEKGNYVEARRICVEMSRLMPDNPATRASIELIDVKLKEQEAVKSLDSGDQLVDQGKDAEALSKYNEALALFPNATAIHEKIEKVQSRIANMKAYMEAMAAARRAAPNPDVSTGNLKKAAVECEKALHAKPGDSAATGLLTKLNAAINSRKPLPPGSAR